METRLHFEILPQPDDITCGPTCLQAVYAYYDDKVGLAQVIDEVRMLAGGGTLAALLGCHALVRGYQATLYTYDMHVFDPTWFSLSQHGIADKLKIQLEIKHTEHMKVVTYAYLDFIGLGGKILFADLTIKLLRGFLKRKIPILTGLSSTYLYRSAREVDLGKRLIYDDIRGVPTGHFVVLAGYHMPTSTAMLADPLNPNPMSDDQYYEVKLNRLIPAIMLGSLTHDANFLVITPKKSNQRGNNRVHSRCH